MQQLVDHFEHLISLYWYYWYILLFMSPPINVCWMEILKVAECSHPRGEWDGFCIFLVYNFLVRSALIFYHLGLVSSFLSYVFYFIYLYPQFKFVIDCCQNHPCFELQCGTYNPFVFIYIMLSKFLDSLQLFTFQILQENINNIG